MTPVERRILIKVSTMYYLEHMKQTEIAKRLGVERTTVSKFHCAGLQLLRRIVDNKQVIGLAWGTSIREL